MIRNAAARVAGKEREEAVYVRQEADTKQFLDKEEFSEARAIEDADKLCSYCASLHFEFFEESLRLGLVRAYWRPSFVDFDFTNDLLSSETRAIIGRRASMVDNKVAALKKHDAAKSAEYDMKRKSDESIKEQAERTYSLRNTRRCLIPLKRVGKF
jgi:hypothetical protein